MRGRADFRPDGGHEANQLKSTQTQFSTSFIPKMFTFSQRIRSVRLPSLGGRPPSDESDASSRDGQEVERGAMASSWSKTWDGLKLSSEEPSEAEPQRPATARRTASWEVSFRKRLDADPQPDERLREPRKGCPFVFFSS